MTYNVNCTLSDEILEQIAEQGLEFLPELIRIVINAAMQAERQAYLGLAPYERSPERRDQANGYKPKTLATRVGKIRFDVPQVRKGPFYPNALERGLRSERALKLALAEMYVQGVSTRKVAAITEQLCGFDVSSTQVSQATALLDEQLGGQFVEVATKAIHRQSGQATRRQSCCKSPTADILDPQPTTIQSTARFCCENSRTQVTSVVPIPDRPAPGVNGTADDFRWRHDQSEIILFLRSCLLAIRDDFSQHNRREEGINEYRTLDFAGTAWSLFHICRSESFHHTTRIAGSHELDV